MVPCDGVGHRTLFVCFERVRRLACSGSGLSRRTCSEGNPPPPALNVVVCQANVGVHRCVVITKVNSFTSALYHEGSGTNGFDVRLGIECGRNRAGQ